MRLFCCSVTCDEEDPVLLGKAEPVDVPDVTLALDAQVVGKLTRKQLQAALEAVEPAKRAAMEERRAAVEEKRAAVAAAEAAHDRTRG